ncbi:MAG: VOC family protein [Acidimicrobiaceae bacterium]
MLESDLADVKCTMSSLVIFTKNVRQMTTFYENVLDLDAVVDAEDNALLRGDGGEIFIHAAHESVGTTYIPEDAAFKPAFNVASLTSALIQVEDAGGDVTQRTFEFGGVHHHDVLDPDGNVIQLRSNSK